MIKRLNSETNPFPPAHPPPLRYIFRNEHYLGIHDACVKGGEFVTEGVLHKGKRDLVLRLHDILVRGDGRVRFRQHHIQEEVRNLPWRFRF